MSCCHDVQLVLW